MELLEIMRHRRSVRNYTGEAVPEEALKKILQAALLSASGRAYRPWDFIVIRDKETLEELAHCREYGAGMLAGADCAIVVTGNEEKSDTWIEDCSITMANMYLMADALGVGCCWIQGRGRTAEDSRTTEDFVREVTGFPRGHRLAAIMSLGMPAEHGAAYELDELKWEKIHQEKF